MKRKVVFTVTLIVAIVLIIGIVTAGYLYNIVTTNFKIEKTTYVYVDTSKSFDSLIQQIQDSAKVENLTNFKLVAKYQSYLENMKTGRYAIAPDDNVWSVVNKLKRGLQTPKRITFNNVRLKSELTEKISNQLMFSNQELSTILEDSVKCASYGFTPQTIVAMFIPNTYEFYWDIGADKFVDRMEKEYSNFWNDSRRGKAERLDMTPLEVSTLASIVEEECYYPDEYPIVAGLYINRLKRGQLLQADPTVKYAVGDFSLQRILYKHLEIDSPYNTYKYEGLPPSPIRIPSIRGIDAVLNYTQHDYLYMCAKEDFSGRHNFAVTHAEHNRNAERYRQALNQRGIY